MNFDLSPEQKELRRVLRQMLWPSGTVEAIVRRSSREDEHASLLWRRLAVEMGLVGLTLGGPVEAVGNQLDVAVVAHELGRVLYGGPYLSTMLTGTCLDEASLTNDHDPARHALASITSGGTVGALAGVRVLADPPLRATPGGQDRDDWIIDGIDALVLDGASAEVMLAFALVESSVALFWIERLEDTKRSVRPGIDLNREIASVDFVETSAYLIEPDAAALYARVANLACVYLASELVGTAERSLEMMVEHASQRIQFGKPLGSFQAIKHMCAEAALAVESIDCQSLYAACQLVAPRSDADTLVSMAKAAASDVALGVTGDLIQVLGGIGYTWEHSAHSFFRRATSSRQLFGAPALHRQRVANTLFAGGDHV
jgi:alkylation response protein AidB-like acyl-CoA dehydrogenase